MARRNLAAALVAVLLVAGLALGILWLSGGDGRPVRDGPATSGLTKDMGVTYVPVTARSARYYGLGIDYGALVTEVTPGSLADRAGLRPGDVILSFNGVPVSEGTSLARLIMDCAEGHDASPHLVTMDVWIDGCIHRVVLTHGVGTAY